MADSPVAGDSKGTLTPRPHPQGEGVTATAPTPRPPPDTGGGKRQRHPHPPTPSPVGRGGNCNSGQPRAGSAAAAQVASRMLLDSSTQQPRFPVEDFSGMPHLLPSAGWGGTCLALEQYYQGGRRTERPAGIGLRIRISLAWCGSTRMSCR